MQAQPEKRLNSGENCQKISKMGEKEPRGIAVILHQTA
jgi:hypothetical protein